MKRVRLLKPLQYDFRYYEPGATLCINDERFNEETMIELNEDKKDVPKSISVDDSQSNDDDPLPSPSDSGGASGNSTLIENVKDYISEKVHNIGNKKHKNKKRHKR